MTGTELLEELQGLPAELLDLQVRTYAGPAMGIREVLDIEVHGADEPDGPYVELI